MTHSGTDHHSSSSQAPFSAAEWDMLRAEDQLAAKHIVWLMQGIFIMGLIGYLIIAWIVK